MKKENTGETLLIPKQEWVPKQELQGDELKVMTHPIIKKTYNKDRKNHFKPGGPYFPDLGTHTIKELDNILLR